MGPHTVLPITISCPVLFSWISSMVCNLFPFKGDSSFGTSPKWQGTKSGLSHLGDLMFCQKTAWDVIHEKVCCRDKAANHQLPIAAAFWFIQIVSREDCSSLMQHRMQIHCSTCPVILNATSAQYTCSFKGTYHWLVQWSRHCSHMCIPVHSPWLPSYIDIANHFH